MPRKKKTTEVKEQEVRLEFSEILKGTNEFEEVEWNGGKLMIRPRMGYEQFFELSKVVSASCFVGDEYHPEYLEFLKDICLVSAYTNLVMPEDNNIRWQLLYYTDLLYTIREHIDNDEWYAFAAAIEDMNRAREERNNSVGFAAEKFVNWLDNLTNVVTKFDKEDLENMMKILTEVSKGTD